MSSGKKSPYKTFINNYRNKDIPENSKLPKVPQLRKLLLAKRQTNQHPTEKGTGYRGWFAFI